jgi:HlyD family secretion protein
MKKGIATILCAAVLISALTACGGSDERLNVTTAKVKSTGTLLAADYIGTIHAASAMAVYSTVSAKVASVNVKLGQQVKAGDILMQLDTSDAALALKQAQAALDTANISAHKVGSAANPQAAQQTSQALAAAQNELHDAQANYALIKKEYDQNILTASAQTAYDQAKNAYTKTSLMASTGAASPNDLKLAQDALNSASAQLESAKAAAQNTLNAADTKQKNAQNALNTAEQNSALTQQTVNPDNAAAAKAGVKSAEATVQVAQKRISDSTVRAAIDGTVGAVNVKAGDMVSPQLPAFQISGNAGMKADASVTENRALKLTVGSKATVYPSSGGSPIVGTVSEISSMASAQSGLFPVKILLTDGQRLMDGMQATIHFPETETPGTVLVPSRSVLNRDGKSVVFVARNGKAAEVAVIAGETQGAYVSVKGLSGSDEVLVQGADKAKSGDDLHVISNANG